MKLQMKILLPIIALMVLLLGVSSYLSYRQASDSLRASLLESMQGEAKALSRATNSLMSDAMRDISREAGSAVVRDFLAGDVKDPQNLEQVNRELERIATSYPKFQWIVLLNTQGTAVAASPPEVIGVNSAEREYFRESMRDKLYLSAPLKNAVDGKGVMVVSAPIKRDGNIIGVLYGTLSLDRLYEVAVAPIQIGESGYAYVLDENGLVVAAKDPAMLFNPNLATGPYYRQWAASKKDGSDEVPGNNGRPVIVYHAYEPLSKLTAIIRSEYDEAFSGVFALRNTSMIIAAVAIVLGIAVVLLVVRPMVKALNKGVIFASEVAAGKLDGKLDIARKDEIGQLAEALRAIPESLKAIVEEYAELGGRITRGELNAEADERKFTGDFAALVRGTNNIVSRFRMIIDNIPSPVGVFNKDLKATYLNNMAQEVAGSDYRGKTDEELLHREDFGTPADGLSKAVQSNARASGETTAHPRGLNLDISYTAIPLHDENGRMSAVLQLITDLTEIKKTQRTIIEVANQALDIANRLAAASEELSAQVDQVTQGSDIQRDRASSTATAMEEMNSTVMEVARNAGQSREQAETMQTKANDGAGMVRQVIQAIKHVNEVALALESNMQSLGEQAEAIGGVMNVISDIADQTNLLALNAAIEAARAGEAGRGFAVVADEVRKLAEKTMGATAEVGASIHGIQSATAGNIQRVSEATEGVSKATELANISGEALSEILNLATDNATLITAIATAAEEQSATSEEINRSVDEINRIAGETAHGMSEAASAVQELSRMAQELNSLLDRLKN